MGETKGVEIGEVEQHISNGYPRDLLQRLTSTNPLRFTQAMKREEIEQEDEEEDEIELNLGLSLGGRFGVDPPKQSSSNNNNKLLRASSMIAGLSTTSFLREDDGAAAASSVICPLNRTNSLPMESEEEWRKRKELQSLRRMEAKRKRSEKQKNIKLGKERASLERNCVEEEDGGGGGGGGGLPGFLKQLPKPQQQQVIVGGNGFAPPAVVATPFGLPSWASSAHRGSVAGSLDGKSNHGGGQGYLPPSSQGSHGSSSSAISEFESLRPVQGLGNCNESRSPSSVQSAQEQNEQKPIATPTSTNTKTAVSIKVEVESPSKKPRISENGVKETGMKVMEDMPCVSTKGDGPNGRRIEGFLYKYKKGEDVRIVCVCHGSFLTPAEFVKHAGGGDVVNPLKHIVVTPSSSFL